ncbi:MAG: hypothetical protein P4L99_06175 [Chthoniobacter sp.]|nr:hypothetical protein [Chthoniobacter sp.]
MKTFPLVLSFFLVLTCVAAVRGANPTLIALKKGDDASTPKSVQSYEDVFTHIPADLRSTKANAWTQIQREEVNAALKEALIDQETPATLRLKVTDIADWGGWTFYANIPNHRGYPIRVFGKFTDDWKPKFTVLKKGEAVVLQGVLSSVTYRNLWGKFTLSICLKNCTFTRSPAANEPSVAL